MDVRVRRIENLERILKDLLEIQALALGTDPCPLCLWLDLAITETRSQIEKVRLETIH